jgi:hypothetical protein
MTELADYRSRITVEEFDKIPTDEEAPIDRYYDALIRRNAKFYALGSEFPGGYEEITFVKYLSRGQQLLILLGVFDLQVKNGGITEFIWNYPGYIFPVRDAIAYLGPPELLAIYDKAIETLVGKKELWLELRKEWRRVGESPQWETFREAYEMLDLSWFDNDYLDQYGRNSDGQWVVLAPGLNSDLLTRLAKYIRSNKDEFIET